MRSQRPNVRINFSDACVSAISRPSKAGSNNELSLWRSNNVIRRPVSASAFAKQRPAGPAPMIAISTFVVIVLLKLNVVRV